LLSVFYTHLHYKLISEIGKKFVEELSCQVFIYFIIPRTLLQ